MFLYSNTRKEERKLGLLHTQTHFRSLCVFQAAVAVLLYLLTRRKAEILCQILYVSCCRLLGRTFFTPFCSLRAVCVQLKGDLVQYICHNDFSEQMMVHSQF